MLTIILIAMTAVLAVLKFMGLVTLTWLAVFVPTIIALGLWAVIFVLQLLLFGMLQRRSGWSR